MTIKPSVAPVGTGQEGASTPKGRGTEVPIHLEGGPDKRIDDMGNRAAGKGFDRQKQQDQSEFTK
jgi:hypothetical protein